MLRTVRLIRIFLKCNQRLSKLSAATRLKVSSSYSPEEKNDREQPERSRWRVEVRAEGDEGPRRWGERGPFEGIGRQGDYSAEAAEPAALARVLQCPLDAVEPALPALPRGPPKDPPESADRLQSARCASGRWVRLNQVIRRRSLVFEADLGQEDVNIRTIDLSKNPPPFATLHTEAGCPDGLAADKKGTLYVSDECNGNDVEEFPKGSTI